MSSTHPRRLLEVVANSSKFSQGSSLRGLGAAAPRRRYLRGALSSLPPFECSECFTCFFANAFMICPTSEIDTRQRTLHARCLDDNVWISTHGPRPTPHPRPPAPAPCRCNALPARRPPQGSAPPAAAYHSLGAAAQSLDAANACKRSGTDVVNRHVGTCHLCGGAGFLTRRG